MTDSNSEPLPAATITVQGTSIGIFTDIAGNLTLNVPEDATLVFSYIGYESKVKKAGSQAAINVALTGDTSSLEEVVVVGYDSQVVPANTEND